MKIIYPSLSLLIIFPLAMYAGDEELSVNKALPAEHPLISEWLNVIYYLDQHKQQLENAPTNTIKRLQTKLEKKAQKAATYSTKEANPCARSRCFFRTRGSYIATVLKTIDSINQKRELASYERGLAYMEQQSTVASDDPDQADANASFRYLEQARRCIETDEISRQK